MVKLDGVMVIFGLVFIGGVINIKFRVRFNSIIIVF